MVICLERGADLHMAQLMPLPLTISCSSKTQIGFTFLVPAHLGSPGQWPLNGCVCVYVTNLDVVWSKHNPAADRKAEEENECTHQKPQHVGCRSLDCSNENLCQLHQYTTS